ncbi:MAG: hypothetical protein MPL62_16390, partial [Alphaproteobacteria bacterium]|nr:hypothetical protein [Alphaproteobacteria bacterium]
LVHLPDFNLAPAAFEFQTANDVSLESAGDCASFAVLALLVGLLCEYRSVECFTPESRLQAFPPTTSGSC